MRFPGELKFPDLDHPGVPVDFHVDGTQAEIKLGGESLGRWSLYDVRADRLIASAFLVKLADEEVTFVADDPIDFAYRGVEHMASVWASMKARRIGSRGIAVSRSRKGIVASRLGEVREAMEANLGQKPLAGEPAMPEGGVGAAESPAPVETTAPSDWDQRDQVAEIPAVGDTPQPAQVPPPEAPAPASLTEEQLRLEEERSRLEEERAELERQRAEAEQREANLFEAYRLEVQRLESEREELRRQAAAAAERAAEAVEPAMADIGPVDEATPPEEPAEPLVSPEPEEELAHAAEPLVSPEPEEELAHAAEPAPEADRVQEPVEELEPSVVDLNAYEVRRDETPPPPPAPQPASEDEPAPQPEPKPEPALAGAAPKEKAGLMGAVRAAFRGGAKDHEHRFTEAPGGLGIVRYVCEECGYVSISVGG